MKSLVFSVLLATALLSCGAAVVRADPPKEVKVCQIERGFASMQNYIYTVDTSSFNLRMNEAIVFNIRTPAQDNLVPNAKIQAEFSASGTRQTLDSDANTGILQLANAHITDLILSVISNDPTVDIPFVLYSYHANYPACSVPVSTPGKVWSLPLITQVASGNTPATAFFHLVQPDATDSIFTVTVLGGGEAATLSTSATLSMTGTGDWVDAPIGLTGRVGAAAGLAPGGVYLKISPTAAATPTILRFSVAWSRPDGNPAPPGSITPPPSGSTGGGGAVVPNPTTADETSDASGSIVGSFFTFVIGVTIVYFVIRSAYNYNQGEREFPKFVPHHEEIGRVVTKVSTFVSAAAGRAGKTVPVPGAVRTGSGYNDVEAGED